MSNTAKITLGGQEFDIPELPIGVMKKVVPIAQRMSQRALQARESGVAFDMTEENIDDALEMIAIAVAFGKPGFSRADLDMMVVDLSDIIAASLVVTIQAGGKKLGEKMPELLKNLLAKVAPAEPSTLTPSLQTSASASDGSGITSSGQ